MVPGPAKWEQELYFNPNDGHFLFKLKDLYSCADQVVLGSDNHHAGCGNKEEAVTCQYAKKSVPSKQIVHNHPPPARPIAEYFLFRWKCLKMVVEMGASLLCSTDAVRTVYKHWPFYMQRNAKYLCQAMSKVLKLRLLWSTAKKGTELAKKGEEFLAKFPDASIETFQKLLESNKKFWGPPHFGKLCIQWKI